MKTDTKGTVSRNNRFFQSLIFLFLPAFLIALAPFNEKAFAATGGEMAILQMFYAHEELKIVTSSRKEKLLNEVAENVTVVTAEEIQAIGAHTLVDVLNYVTGVQMALAGGPGMHANPSIQGSHERHVRLLLDGITMNTVGSLNAYWALIPVQQIEKIEIIKGPASSAWGSSLGGTINVISKGPPKDQAEFPWPKGTVSTSYGEANTGDFRGEFSGRVEGMGYYLSVGKLKTDGLTPGTDFDSDNVYAKLQWNPWQGALFQYTMGYNEGAQGTGDYPSYGYTTDIDFDIFYSTVSLDTPLWGGADLQLSLRTLQQGLNQFWYLYSTGTRFSSLFTSESTHGGSGKVTWKKGRHSLVLGADLDSSDMEHSNFANRGAELDTWAVFANDTIRLRNWTITPGLRYDHTSTSGGFVSPGIGITWLGLDNTILRATVGRGFSIPSLSSTNGSTRITPAFQSNPNLKMEKVWSYQIGMETTWLEKVWFKVGLFRHEVRDLIAINRLPGGKRTPVNKDRARRQGVEVEAKTLPIYNTSLYAGFSFIDARDSETGKILDEIARYTGDVGIQYKDEDSLRIDLKGHFIWWNMSSQPISDFKGNYDDFVWDLFASKKVWSGHGRDLELFFNWRNIFNTSQNLYNILPNPGTWVEGGIRATF